MPTMPKSKIGLPPKPAPSMPPPAAFAPPLLSASIHESIMRDPTNDPSVAATMEAIRHCRLACEHARAGAIAIHGDELATHGMKHVRADKFAHETIKPALQAVDRQAGRLASEIKTIETKLNAPSPTATGLSQEIRARLASLKQPDRMKEIMASITDGGDAIAYAVLSAPPFLTGMNSIEQANVRQRWGAARFPAELERLALLRKAEEHLTRAGQLSLAFAVQCSDQEVLEAARRNTARIEAALAAEPDGDAVH